MVRVIRQQNCLPREAADFPPFKIFKTLIAIFLRKLL